MFCEPRIEAQCFICLQDTRRWRAHTHARAHAHVGTLIKDWHYRKDCLPFSTLKNTLNMFTCEHTGSQKSCKCIFYTRSHTHKANANHSKIAAFPSFCVLWADGIAFVYLTCSHNETALSPFCAITESWDCTFRPHMFARVCCVQPYLSLWFVCLCKDVWICDIQWAIHMTMTCDCRMTNAAPKTLYPMWIHC